MQAYSKKNNGYLVYFIILILLVVLANIFSASLRNIFYTVSNSLQEVFWSTGQSVSNFFGGIASIGFAKNEINQLKLENNELNAKIVLLKETQDENAALKQALGLELNKKYQLISAKFISKNISEDVIVLNRGGNDGVEEGMPIITSGGILAGKIIEVYPTYSKANLLSAKKMSFDVRIKHNDKDISAVATGMGNLNLSLNLIPQNVEISDGDMVVTDSLGNIFPELLSVGRVKNIKKNDVSPFQKADIEQFFNISQSLIIFIATGSNQ